MKLIKLKKISLKRIVIWAVILTALFLFVFFENNVLSISRYSYESNLIPQDFDGFKIIHISDLHNKKLRDSFTDTIKKENPDIIVITGDIVDYSSNKMQNAVNLSKKMTEIAPTYYVTGNHEMWGSYFSLIDELEKVGVNVLEDKKVEIKVNNSSINLYGLSYEAFCYADGVNDTLGKLIEESDTLNILLAHRPDAIDIYSKYDIDLVFSGHAHGGQIRLPFTEGLYAPDQGIFPKLTAGIHTSGETSEVISRGLGNSHSVPRLFNRPELVILTLNTK